MDRDMIIPMIRLH